MPKRVMEGVVVSAKQTKTAIVRIERTYMHPVMKKIVRRSKKYHAHDEGNVAVEGQTITIRECVPKSKLKRWEVIPAEGSKS